MPTTDLLKTFGLSKNPFTDRTAEKTFLDPLSLYIHSDLRGFQPSETTYVFFGRRGSGKTTIRLQMETVYKAYNETAAASGKSRGHFMVDMSRPGHLTACLSTFQDTIKATTDNWDAAFQEQWTSADMVDSILSYAATNLLRKVTSGSDEGKQMLESLRRNPDAAKRFLLLCHLYARTDATSLARVRQALPLQGYTHAQLAIAAGAAGAVVAGAVAYGRYPQVGEGLENAWDEVTRVVPVLDRHPKIILGTVAAVTAGGAAYYLRVLRQRASDRAAAVQRVIRVVKPQPAALLSSLINNMFTLADTAETVRSLCIGISAHQKLELLESLCKVLGYESLCVFGDCFDEVTLLDPVKYPGAIKIFAREVCRNDILNFGRLHFFFPDSRLALDLNTDKTLKEARFDRHFVRDLAWSRHQLEELAERRFRAAQEALMAETGVTPSAETDANGTTFADLFKKVRGEDFSSYLAKLSTPRELMIMMTEMFSRIEANPGGGLTAQDMEIAVTKAMEQAV